MKEYEALQQYDEYLDDVYPDITVAGLTWTTSYTIKNVDPIAYRTGFSDWCDSEGIEVE